MKEDEIKEYINTSKDILSSLDENEILNIVDILKNSNKIFLCGNGGSSATASHLANDLQKMCNLKALCLTDNTPLLTAWSNDVDYDTAFQPQLELLADEHDTLIVLSGSGNSPNLWYAITMAKRIGMNVIAFLGSDGGVIKKKVKDITIVNIPSDMQHAEDWHLILGHLICRVIGY